MPNITVQGRIALQTSIGTYNVIKCSIDTHTTDASGNKYVSEYIGTYIGSLAWNTNQPFAIGANIIQIQNSSVCSGPFSLLDLNDTNFVADGFSGAWSNSGAKYLYVDNSSSQHNCIFYITSGSNSTSVPLLLENLDGDIFFGYCIITVSQQSYFTITPPSNGYFGTIVQTANFTPSSIGVPFQTPYVYDIIQNSGLVKPSIADYTIRLNQYVFRYNGGEIYPTVTVTNPDTGEVLEYDTDYTLDYEDNINPGTASVIVTGLGDYTGTRTVNYSIVDRILSLQVECLLDKYTWVYTGDEIIPAVTVRDEIRDLLLIENRDYTLTYENNINIGTANVKITGIDTWSGLVQLNYEIISDDDPYGEDPSGPGGGDGDHDDESDTIPFPSLPSLSAITSGFATVYVPTLTELSNLSTYMWGNSFENVFNRLFANPMDAILGLSIVPCAVSYTDGVVFVGNVGTGVSMRIATEQYVVVDLGQLTIEEFWGSYLDYTPYTHLTIYLPYIGFRDINPDEVIGKPMRLHYEIDIISGACVAMIRVGDSVLYSFSGSCAQNLPINSSDWTENVKAAISVGATIGSLIATGGASAPITAAAAVNLASNAQNVIKPRIQNSGMVGGSSGFLGVQTPYIIITRPDLCLPDHQNNYTGYPVYSTVRLDQLTGFTKVADIHLDTIPATQEEMDELLNILHEGFIIQ